MISFKEKLNEDIRVINEAKREVLEGVAATKAFREIENESNQEIMIDDEGLEQRIIMTKQGMYIVYFDYEDAPMTVIKNPNRKDMINFKAAMQPS